MQKIIFWCGHSIILIYVEISIATGLTLKIAGGGNYDPLVVRPSAISHRYHLEVYKLLTFPKIMFTHGWYISSTSVQILARVCRKPTKFLRQILEKWISFKLLMNKTSDFISNLNYWCSENSFEVLHVSPTQKLRNADFSPLIFLTLPLATSAMSWGRTNSLSDLISVSNEA